MAFRQMTNRHDAWIASCRLQSVRIADVGLPPEAFASERVFREFVTAGSVEGVPASLDALPDDRVMLLFHFVTDYFDLDAINFTALEARRARRWHFP